MTFYRVGNNHIVRKEFDFTFAVLTWIIYWLFLFIEIIK